MTGTVHDLFDLGGRLAVVTGGAGLLGRRHAEALAEFGANVALLDLDGEAAEGRGREIAERYGVACIGLAADIASASQVAAVRDRLLDRFGRIDVLINNAANNPKVEDGGGAAWSRLENFPAELWSADLAVGLTGAFLCSQAFGAEMAKRGGGAILNVASDLALIGPDQRIYRTEGTPDERQNVKPVTYSVVKAGLLGLTRYLATYWAEQGVRANAISPGGVAAGQDAAFVRRLTRLIPLGRMAHPDEYKAAVVFLCSDASSYMTGANLVIDGGRTAW